MKKSSFALIAALSLTLMGCSQEAATTPQNTNTTPTETAPTAAALKFESATYSTVADDGSLTDVSVPTFLRGDKIAYALINVGPFKKGDDGLDNVRLDMMVTDPDGKVLSDDKNILGDSGHTALENDIAKSPYGVFETTKDLAPGKYDIKLTITDMVSGGSATSTGTVTLK